MQITMDTPPAVTVVTSGRCVLPGQEAGRRVGLHLTGMGLWKSPRLVYNRLVEVNGVGEVVPVAGFMAPAARRARVV